MKMFFQSVLEAASVNIGKIGGGGGNITVGKKRRRGRTCRFEELEGREMLSVTIGATDFAAIKSQYSDLGLTNFANYNIIEVSGVGDARDQNHFAFSEAGLRGAVNRAVQDIEYGSDDCLIVVRTTAKQNKITLGGKSMVVETVCPWLSITIVSLGTDSLTIDGSKKTEDAFLFGSDSLVALGGLTITRFTGGGISSFGTLTITRCTITENVSENVGSINNWGTMYVGNCVIANNDGSGIYNGYSKSRDEVITPSLIVVNCTIVRNTAIGIENTGEAWIYNTIVVQNIEDDIDGTMPGWMKPAITRGYCNLTIFTDWDGGLENFVYDSSKPLFVNAAKGDYRLVSNSQAVDKGSNANVPKRATMDLAGNPRVFGSSIDIGAYEYYVAKAVEVTNEYLTKDWIYKNHTVGEKVKDAAGKETDFKVTKIFKNSTGQVYAIAIKRGKTSEHDEQSILVLRAPGDPLDTLADTNVNGIGYALYQSQATALKDWAKTAVKTGKVSLTGHSLGGTLAQWLAVDLSREGVRLEEVETFNATGISKTAADRFVQGTTKVTHHIVDGDFVSMGGEAFIKGTNWIYYANADDLNDLHIMTFEQLEDKYGINTKDTISSQDLNSNTFHFKNFRWLQVLYGAQMAWEMSQNQMAPQGVQAFQSSAQIQSNGTIDSPTDIEFLSPSNLFFRGAAERFRTIDATAAPYNPFKSTREHLDLGKGYQGNAVHLVFPVIDLGNIPPSNFATMDSWRAYGFAVNAYRETVSSPTATEWLITADGRIKGGDIEWQLYNGGLFHAEGATGETYNGHNVNYLVLAGQASLINRKFPGPAGEVLSIASLDTASMEKLFLDGTGDTIAMKGTGEISFLSIPDLEWLGKGSQKAAGLNVNGSFEQYYDPSLGGMAVKTTATADFFIGTKDFISGSGSLTYNAITGEINASLTGKVFNHEFDILNITTKVTSPNPAIAFSGPSKATGQQSGDSDYTVDAPSAKKMSEAMEGECNINGVIQLRVEENVWVMDDGEITFFGSITTAIRDEEKVVQGKKSIAVEIDLIANEYDLKGLKICEDVFTHEEELEPQYLPLQSLFAPAMALNAASPIGEYLLILEFDGKPGEEHKGTFILPDGIRITEEDMENDDRFTLVKELQSNFLRTYYIVASLDEIAQWQFEVENIEGEVMPMLYEFVPPLEVETKAITKNAAGIFVFDIESATATPDAVVTIYLNDDNSTFVGVPVYRTTLGDLLENGWNPEDITGETYFAYIRVECGNAVPEMVYFVNPITINMPTAVSIIENATGYKETIKGVKVAKKNTPDAPTINSLTFTWTQDAKQSATSKVLIEVYTPKPKGSNVQPLIATIEIDTVSNQYVVAGLIKGTGGITVTPNGNVYTIKIEGLQTGTKYTLNMQAVSGTQTSKVTKVSATTVKYTAVKMSKSTTTLTSITLNWEESALTETTGYEIEVFKGTGNKRIPVRTETVAGKDTLSKVITNLEAGTKYSFEVHAVASGLGVKSAIAKASADTKKVNPIFKFNKPAQDVTAGTITGTWGLGKGIDLSAVNSINEISFSIKGSAGGVPFDSGPLTIANGGTFVIDGITFRLRLETDGRLIITDVNKALVQPGAGTVKLTLTLTGLKAKESGSPFEWSNVKGKKASTTMSM